MRERLSFSWRGYGDGDGAFPGLTVHLFEGAIRFCRSGGGAKGRLVEKPVDLCCPSSSPFGKACVGSGAAL